MKVGGWMGLSVWCVGVVVGAIAVCPREAASGQDAGARRARISVLRDHGGFSFRVAFGADRVTLKRTSYELPGKGAVLPAWGGAAVTIGEVRLGDGARRTGVKQSDHEHQVATYALGASGSATVVVSRLTPAVLVDSGDASFAFRGGGGGLTQVAFVSGGAAVVRSAKELTAAADAKVRLDEPWLLGWFGKGSPYRGYREAVDVHHEHFGPDKRYLASLRPRPLDVPILFRLEHRPTGIRLEGGTLMLRFATSAGKIAIMPPFGGRMLDPADTDKWAAGLPNSALARCRRWSAKLRDYPLSVTGTLSAEEGVAAAIVRQSFTWASFADDWRSPPVHAAPIPPMLATALGGGVNVEFRQNTKAIQPVDDWLMDTPGLAMTIKGCNGYDYFIGGLDQLIACPAARAPAAAAAPHVAALEKHVAEMIDAGHLAPLFYVYGGIGGAGPAYFYWANPAELAVAAAEAYPWLSPDLRHRLVEYLRAEWKANPPFAVSDAAYRRGANRAPYDVPWDDIGRGLAATMFREKARRGWCQFADLYGVAAYYELTGDREPPGLRRRCDKMMRDLLAGLDWALMTPIHRTRRVGFFRGVNYFDRNGQATCNGLLAGAIGLVRLGKRFGWRNEGQIGMCLLARSAVARVGQARYTAELHRRGLVDGEAKEDWRTLVHIDRRCALTLRGHLAAVVREDQETPPFIGLVPEVGRLLGRHARAECAIYLDHLDRSMSLWYLSEAPKQSASEQRLCPLQHKSGNVLAQYWVLGKRGEAFGRYVDTTRFKGDLYYIRNLAALIDSYGR